MQCQIRCKNSVFFYVPQTCVPRPASHGRSQCPTNNARRRFQRLLEMHLLPQLNLIRPRFENKPQGLWPLANQPYLVPSHCDPARCRTCLIHVDQTYGVKGGDGEWTNATSQARKVRVNPMCQRKRDYWGWLDCFLLQFGEFVEAAAGI